MLKFVDLRAFEVIGDVIGDVKGNQSERPHQPPGAQKLRK